MITITPAGSDNTSSTVLDLTTSFKEKFPKPYRTSTTNQPHAAVDYIVGTPVLNSTTVFVPITAVLTIIDLGCCKKESLVYTEDFTVSFLDQTSLPASIKVESNGSDNSFSDIRCGYASSYRFDDSITITITVN